MSIELKKNTVYNDKKSKRLRKKLLNETNKMNLRVCNKEDEKMIRKGLQRGLAMALSAAMLLTGINFPATDVNAAVVDQVVWSDDIDSMTTAEAGWAVTWGNDSATAGVEARATNQWATNNKTTWWDFKTETEKDTLTLTKTVSDLEVGAYKASVDTIGGSATGVISITTLEDLNASGNEDVDTQTENITLGSWPQGGTDNFVTTTTDVLNVAEGSDVTIKITFDSQIKGWFDLDNIKLIQEIDEDVLKAEAAAELDTLIKACEALKEADYKEGWAELQTAITDAKAVYDAIESKTLTEVQTAVTALQEAKSNLVEAGAVENAGIMVKKVPGITEDFVRGADVSTFASLIDSGVKYYGWNGEELDEVGFFALLKDSGVNYVRLRLWNDPYYTDADGVKYGYGAGNCDVETVTKIGKWATEAGLKVMVDFHYSDFWADPGKYRAPKAWEGYTVEQKVEALGTFTEESLNSIIKAGVDVGMVQVGNETTAGIAGEAAEEDWGNMCQLFAAGCAAVRKVAAANDKDIKIAIHFTNPEKTSTMKGFADTLNKYNIDYDVFASSYYSYWHGTLENLTSVLSYVAETYGKEVIVAETSWAHTLEDGDGQPNVVREGQNDTGVNYPSTVQGQANAVRDVMEAVANVGNKGLGVMYWEPAWLPVNVYDAKAENADEIYAANYAAWEKYGCGWASSYAIDYDGTATEETYGGSEWDNQAVFDFAGNPLPSLNVFKYVETGATTPKYMDYITSPEINVLMGDDIAAVLPTTVVGNYNDGTIAEGLAVDWDEDSIAKITKFGRYKVRGTATYTTVAGETATIEAICIVNVEAVNILPQGDFEDGRDKWTTAGTGINSRDTENPRNGSKCLAFYNGNDFAFTAKQTITAEKAGSYGAFMYLQGDAMGEKENISIQLSNDTQGTSAITYTAVAGYKNWQMAEVKPIAVAAGDAITITLSVAGSGAGWGSIDDVCLYLGQEGTFSSITYNMNDGVNDAENPNCYMEGTAAEINDPSREGYAFEGWYTDSEFATEFTGITAETTGNVELYAKWKQVVFPINYVLNDGVNSEKNPVSYTIGKAVTLADPSREGYAFEGWYTDSELTTEFAGITAETTGDVTVYAKWKKVVYAVAYELNGGTNHADNAATYEVGKGLTLNAPTREGYTFKGWYTDKEFTTAITAIAADAEGDVTVYAKWEEVKTEGSDDDDKTPEENKQPVVTPEVKPEDKPVVTTYKINYELNGGTNATENPATYNEADVTLKDATRKNYTFEGWYTDAACTTKITSISAATKADVTVYAKWKKVSVKKASIKSVKNNKKKQAKVTIKKVSGAEGYKIQYSTNKKFKSGVKSVTTKKTTATLKKLKKGKKYYVRVCAYKTDSTGAKVYGKYSAAKQVKIKK